MINEGEEFSCNGIIPVKSSCIGIIPEKELGPGGHVFPGWSSLRAVFTCISVRYQVQSIFCKLFTGLVIIGCTKNVPAPSLFSNSSKNYEMFFNLLLARKNTLFTGPYKNLSVVSFFLKKKKRNQRQIAFSISWTRQEPCGLVGSSVI